MNNNEEIFLEQIFAKPTYKFHIRELAKITKLNPNTIINISKKLIKEGILVVEKKKHITEIFFNLGNPEAVIRKKIFNLKQIYDSRIIDIIKEKFQPEAVVIIGSYSRGEDIEDSDIDIVAVSKKDYETISLKKFEDFLKRKVHVIITDYKQMSEEFYINFINGIVLYGAINKK